MSKNNYCTWYIEVTMEYLLIIHYR